MKIDIHQSISRKATLCYDLESLRIEQSKNKKTKTDAQLS